MNTWRILALVFFLSSATHGGQVNLRTTPLIDSSLYDRARVEKEIIQRIQAGNFDNDKVDLCIDDPSQCDSKPFEPYKQVDEGKTTYELTIQKDDWDSLPALVKDAAVRGIVYDTWGHAKRKYSPLDVVIDGEVVGTSPLAYLAPKSGESYLHFARPESLVGGVGKNSYGPNCWYNAISAVADGSSAYARSQMLTPCSWDRPRFMGPTEFRRHIRNFTKVSEPQFGDIIRYYTDSPIYGGLIYGGEIHAAVYIGKEIYLDKEKHQCVREIALTKNGRSELDFLIFQDIQGLDETYLPAPGSSAPTSGDPGQQIKKGYFRVNRGATLLDPATLGGLSDAHGAYQVDLKNYMDRWLCMAKLIDPPLGTNMDCYSYPTEWMTLLPIDPAQPPPLAHGMKTMKMQRAPLLKMKDRVPSSLLPAIRGGFSSRGLATKSSG